MNAIADKGAAVIIGAGDATGSVVAEAFAQTGLIAAPVRRNGDRLLALRDRILANGGQCVAIGGDARDEAAMIALFDSVKAEIGPVRVLVFNIGANSPMSIHDETVRRYTKIWEMCAFAGFITAREAARRMVPRGIHVVHSIIDGAIDTEFIRSNFPDRYAMKDNDSISDPHAIAAEYVRLHQQPRSAWTNELDLRPWIEKW